MVKLPRITPRKALAALLRAGFYIHQQVGSHINLRHDIKLHLYVTIPNHNRDLAPKTLKSIISQAGLAVEEFLKII